MSAAATGLRVLMTVDAVGGVWTYALTLARALTAEGATVALLGFGPPPAAPAVAEARAVGRLDWAAEPLDWQAKRLEELAGVPRALAAACQRFRPDVVQLALPSQAAGLDLQVPVVAVAHSCLATWFRAVRDRPLPTDLAWKGDLTRRGLVAAQVTVAPTRAHADLLRRCYPGLPMPEVVPNAVCASRIERIEESGAPAVAVGRWWDPGKGGDVLDAAAAHMAVPLRLIGPLESAGEYPFRPLHAETSGALPHAGVMAEMARARFFIAPSLYEPFGLAVAEAAALGLPLLLSDLAGFRELWAEAALFYPARDPAALAAAASRLANDTALRTRLGAAAKVKAEQYGPRRQAAEMIGLYRRLMARHGLRMAEA